MILMGDQDQTNTQDPVAGGVNPAPVADPTAPAMPADPAPTPMGGGEEKPTAGTTEPGPAPVPETTENTVAPVTETPTETPAEPAA